MQYPIYDIFERNHEHKTEGNGDHNDPVEYKFKSKSKINPLSANYDVRFRAA